VGKASNTGEPIRVLLADDHTMFRESIAGVLASYGGMEVVGQTGNDERAVEMARRTRPAVLRCRRRQRWRLREERRV
jgi:DNA-binding NarL/FixJ family response regulator